MAFYGHGNIAPLTFNNGQDMDEDKITSGFALFTLSSQISISSFVSMDTTETSGAKLPDSGSAVIP